MVLLAACRYRVCVSFSVRMADNFFFQLHGVDIRLCGLFPGVVQLFHLDRYFYEKNEKVVSHTKDEAQNIALKKIYYDFIKNKTSEREMICSMVLLKYVEEPSDFLLTYAITCKINMGEFVSF